MSWDRFENNVKDGLIARVTESVEPVKNADGSINVDVELLKIAKLITDEYHLTVIGSKESAGGTSRGFSPAGILALEGSKNLIQASIFAALKLMQQSKVKPNMAVLSPIGSGFFGYWSSVLTPGSISPLPLPLAPPYISPSPGSQIIFPGNTIPIVSGFKNAFSNFDDTGNQTAEQACAKIANDLRVGCEAHMKTIYGIYIGLIPGVIPVPAVSPWIGMIA